MTDWNELASKNNMVVVDHHEASMLGSGHGKRSRIVVQVKPNNIAIARIFDSGSMMNSPDLVKKINPEFETWLRFKYS